MYILYKYILHFYICITLGQNGKLTVATHRSHPLTKVLQLVVDFMIRLSESVCVGQFAKKSRSTHLFVVAFPVAVNHGSQSLSQSDSAPPSFSFKQITNAQFSAESVRLLLLPPLASQRLVVGGAGSRVSENERYERDKLKQGIGSVLSGRHSFFRIPL